MEYLNLLLKIEPLEAMVVLLILVLGAEKLTLLIKRNKGKNFEEENRLEHEKLEKKIEKIDEKLDIATNKISELDGKIDVILKKN